MSYRQSYATPPPSSPPAGPSVDIDRVPIISASGRICRNRWEAALDAIPGGVPACYYVTDDGLNDMFLSRGHKRSELPRLRAEWDEKMDVMLDAGGGKIPVIGGKPNRGDHVRIVTIPDDRLALRFFDGGMERDGIFLFDFVDTHTKKAVNCPSTYEIHALPNPYHMLNMPGRLLSWEATRGIPPNVIKKGEERFSVPEGTPCALVRPGKERFMFAVPQRPRELLPGV